MTAPSLTAPWWQIAFAAMHLLIGRFGASLFYYLRFGKNPNIDMQRTATKSRHRRITDAMGLVYFAWLAAFLVADRSTALLSLGTAVVLTGFFGMLAAQLWMGRAFRIGQDDSQQSDQRELNTGGLFVFSRNPIYVCSFLYMAGATLWAPTLLLCGLLACFAAGIHGLVREEERFLARQFGASYDRYRARTPRYFGWRRA